MDTITLTGVHANGTHGVLAFEHERPQTFVVDVTLHLDLGQAGQSDDLEDTIDYGRMAKDIVSVIEGEHVDLIERLAQLIADRILADAPAVEVIDVTVHKPHAPIVVAFADVSVSITRARSDSGKAAARMDEASSTVTGESSVLAPNAISGAAVPPQTIHNAVVALGGNVGEVETTLRAAVREIDALPGTQVTGISPLYRTAAWGMADGTPDFLNAVVELETTMGSHELLASLQGIEARHGRVRENHWDSRPLDLDIIDYDGITSADPDLALPHPRAWQRAFVLAPWAALNPNARLAGAHGGPVASLLAVAPDHNAVQLESEDWMLSGHADSDTSVPAGGSRQPHADWGWSAIENHPQSRSASQLPPAGAAESDEAVETQPVSRKAIISLDSTSHDAERLFREAIVSIDSIPGNQVQGISPLYHVSRFDGPDAMSAVVQIETKLPAADLIAVLGSIEAAHELTVDLDLVDMEGVTSDEPNCSVPWPSARNHASVLAPWLDMDPDATLGGDPVSFLLAMAPDAGQVGLLSDNWVLPPQ